MRLRAGHHLAYSTNVHPAETWGETFRALEQFTLPLRRAVAPNDSFGLGLRLSDRASRELIEPRALERFRVWLAAHDCYIFTINGFPFGIFHGGPVKERVFAPDWTTRERLDYTNRLFDILAKLIPKGVEGSVSTLPGSFKEFIREEKQVDLIRENLLRCADHIAQLCARHNCRLHLGLEPEPFGLFENTEETLSFFRTLPNDYLGVNYDACHFAVEYENPLESLRTFQDAGLFVSKLHLSSALVCTPTAAARTRLREFAEDVYLHQLIARKDDGTLRRYRDLPLALAQNDLAAEWRIHFHVPLYAELDPPLSTTINHVTGVLDWLAANPGACSHLEMETYTWDVLPGELRSPTLVEQLTREYKWVLARLRERNLA